MMVDLGDMPPSQTLPPPASSLSSRRGRSSGRPHQNLNGRHNHSPHHAAPQLDRKQIEQRIEEDRERHKRLREGIWAVPAGQYAEMEKLWDETSDLGEDDHVLLAEEWQDWEACMATARDACPHRGGAGGERDGDRN